MFGFGDANEGTQPENAAVTAAVDFSPAYGFALSLGLSTDYTGGNVSVSAGGSAACAAVMENPGTGGYTTLTPSCLLWNSEDPSVAAVDDAGVVTGNPAGTATITCSTGNGVYTASLELAVLDLLPPVLRSVTCSSGRATLTWETVAGATRYQITIRRTGSQNASLPMSAQRRGKRRAVTRTAYASQRV